MKDGCYARYITDPLDNELLFGDSEIGNYMRIRQELAQPSKKRRIPDPGSFATESTSQNSNRSGAIVSNARLHRQAPAQDQGPLLMFPNGHLLEISLPVTIMAWIDVSSFN